MKYLFHILLWAQFLGYAQHELGGLVLDEADKSPLEFVGIYNTLDHTMTNADGRFFMLIPFRFRDSL